MAIERKVLGEIRLETCIRERNLNEKGGEESCFKGTRNACSDVAMKSQNN